MKQPSLPFNLAWSYDSYVVNCDLCLDQYLEDSNSKYIDQHDRIFQFVQDPATDASCV